MSEPNAEQVDELAASPANEPPEACGWRSHSRPEGYEVCDCAERLAAVNTHSVARYGNDPAHCQECSAAVQEWVTWGNPKHLDLICPDFWSNGMHLNPPSEGCLCDPAPVQPPAPSGGMLGKMTDPYRGTNHPEWRPPAPDPDETACQHRWAPVPGRGFECSRCGVPKPAPVPPATTGGTDEAERLAENILHALVPDWEQVAFRREANSRDWQQALNAAVAVLASDWLRDRADQAGGAA